jgi:hypothetical protein
LCEGIGVKRIGPQVKTLCAQGVNRFALSLRKVTGLIRSKLDPIIYLFEAAAIVGNYSNPFNVNALQVDEVIDRSETIPSVNGTLFQ